MPRQYTSGVLCVCQVCEKTFYLPPSWVREGRGKHCSRNCSRSPVAESNLFWSKVRKSSGCWLWKEGCNQKGYGKFHRFDKSTIGAHRMAWLLTKGLIPDGLHVLHHCDNPPCCNPDHLFLGTNQDNKKDCCQKGRVPCGEKHHNVKLTAVQVKAIRIQSAEKTYEELSRQYGVCLSAISNIVNKKRWKHIT